MIVSEKKKKQKIVFFCKKGVIAQGDFSLYYRIGSYIMEHYDGYEVFCVNNSVPELQKKFLHSGIQFCDITKDNISQFEDAIFVVAFNQLFFFLDEVKSLKRARVLFLFLHPHIMKWFLNQAGKKFVSVNSIFKMLKNGSAYAFQDESCYLSTIRHSKVRLDPVYFPVVIDEQDKKVQAKDKNVALVNENEINIGWLGRLDKDKVFSLTNLLDNLFDAVEDRRVAVHIIGGGNGLDMIKINKYAPKIRLVFNSYVYGDMCDRYLMSNVDCAVAMGMSSLNVAKLRLPVILPVVSGTPFRDDKFMYLYETKNYCIGWTKEDLSKTGYKTHPIEEIVTDIYEKKQKSAIASRCYDFVNDTFFVGNNIEQMLAAINGTQLTIGKLQRNRSVIFHKALYRMYKIFYNRKGNYNDFATFFCKIIKAIDMPFKERIRWFLKKAYHHWIDKRRKSGK